MKTAPSTFPETPSPSQGSRWWFWGVLFLLTLLWHLFLLVLPWQKLISHGFFTPPPVEIAPVDPSRLNQIRKQWKEQKLLLSQGEQNVSETAPEDARYFSDKNRKVKKEQKARRTSVLPNVPSQTAPQSGAKVRPSLRHLGVTYPAPGGEITPRKAQDPGVFRDEALNDPSLEEGDQNLLNTHESLYYSFFSRMKESIGPQWNMYVNEASLPLKLNPGDYVTEVDIVLDRTGRVVEIHYIRESGYHSLDQAVERTLKAIPQFPNPPAELIDETGKVHTQWTFTLEMGRGPVFSYPAQ